MPKNCTNPSTQARALSQKLGKTIQRLRMADKLSLGDLSEQSGVAKSLISQIERNESNPTIATLSRLSHALGTNIETVLSEQNHDSYLIMKARQQDIPVLKSEDGLCTLKIIGWFETVSWVQWYDFTAEVGGRLESSPHPPGSVENLSILFGTLAVEVDGQRWTATGGETLRYHADTEHMIENIGDTPAHATMVNILAHTVRNR